jgi:hypothetical protein
MNLYVTFRAACNVFYFDLTLNYTLIFQYEYVAKSFSLIAIFKKKKYESTLVKCVHNASLAKI